MNQRAKILLEYISKHDSAIIMNNPPESMMPFDREPGAINLYPVVEDGGESITFFTDTDLSMEVSKDMLDSAEIDEKENTIAFQLPDGEITLSFWVHRQTKVPSVEAA